MKTGNVFDKFDFNNLSKILVHFIDDNAEPCFIQTNFCCH